MAKKYYYYVCVFAGDGPVFVTDVDYRDKVSYWNKNELPKELSMYDADNLVFGLRCNGYNAVTVKSPFEIDYQPYNYAQFECEFVRKETNDGEKQP